MNRSTKNRPPALHEQTVTGKIINVGHEKKDEAIVFEIPLGSLKIVAIANIPEDGQEEAPVYLKWRVAHLHTKHPRFDSKRGQEEGTQEESSDD